MERTVTSAVGASRGVVGVAGFAAGRVLRAAHLAIAAGMLWIPFSSRADLASLVH